MKDLRRMLPCWRWTTPMSGRSSHRWAAAVRSAAAVCHAVWTCSRTVSGPVNITVDTTCRPRTKGHHPDTGRVRSREVHRRPASRRRLSRRRLQIVSETHSRSGWDSTRSPCAAVSVRYRRPSRGHPEGQQSEVGHRYGILLLATDAATAGPKRRAVRRQAVPAVGQRCRRLCENGTAVAKLRICCLIRTVSAADAVLANDGYRAGRRLRNFMHIVCNERNWTWWVDIIIAILFSLFWLDFLAR